MTSSTDFADYDIDGLLREFADAIRSGHGDREATVTTTVIVSRFKQLLGGQRTAAFLRWLSEARADGLLEHHDTQHGLRRTFHALTLRGPAYDLQHHLIDLIRIVRG